MHSAVCDDNNNAVEAAAPYTTRFHLNYNRTVSMCSFTWFSARLSVSDCFTASAVAAVAAFRQFWNVDS